MCTPLSHAPGPGVEWVCCGERPHLTCSVYIARLLAGWAQRQRCPWVHSWASPQGYRADPFSCPQGPQVLLSAESRGILGPSWESDPSLGPLCAWSLAWGSVSGLVLGRDPNFLGVSEASRFSLLNSGRGMVTGEASPTENALREPLLSWAVNGQWQGEFPKRPAGWGHSVAGWAAVGRFAVTNNGTECVQGGPLSCSEPPRNPPWDPLWKVSAVGRIQKQQISGLRWSKERHLVPYCFLSAPAPSAHPRRPRVSFG